MLDELLRDLRLDDLLAVASATASFLVTALTASLQSQKPSPLQTPLQQTVGSLQTSPGGEHWQTLA